MPGPYTITPPVQGQPIPSVGFGQAVKDAINDLDARLSAVEGSLLPRYYIKGGATSRNTTTTPSTDTGTGQLLAGIPLEIGTFEIELVGLFNLTTTGTQGIKTQWGFSGTANGATCIRTCMGPGDSATSQSANQLGVYSAAQATNQTASYFNAASAGWSGFREIAANFIVTAAGTLSLSWSQAVSSANNTNLQGGSYFRITRYA